MCVVKLFALKTFLHNRFIYALSLTDNECCFKCDHKKISLTPRGRGYRRSKFNEINRFYKLASSLFLTMFKSLGKA